MVAEAFKECPVPAKRMWWSCLDRRLARRACRRLWNVSCVRSQADGPLLTSHQGDHVGMIYSVRRRIGVTIALCGAISFKIIRKFVEAPDVFRVKTVRRTCRRICAEGYRRGWITRAKYKMWPVRHASVSANDKKLALCELFRLCPNLHFWSPVFPFCVGGVGIRRRCALVLPSTGCPASVRPS
jgi:hypothetical protein